MTDLLRASASVRPELASASQPKTVLWQDEHENQIFMTGVGLGLSYHGHVVIAPMRNWMAHAGHAVAPRSSMEAERNEALRRLHMAEEALRPFAKAAEDCDVADDLRTGALKPADIIWESAVATSITFGHVARALEVLENGKAALADATNNPSGETP